MNCIPGEKLNQNWRETILIGVSERDIFRLSAAISKERFSIDKTEILSCKCNRRNLNRAQRVWELTSIIQWTCVSGKETA